MSCDLHNHSTCSDGSVPIQRLPGIAARTGLHAIAISDHDTTLSASTGCICCAITPTWTVSRSGSTARS